MASSWLTQLLTQNYLLSRHNITTKVLTHRMKSECRPIRRDLQLVWFRISNQNLHRQRRRQSGGAAAEGRRDFLNELVEFGGIKIADGPEIEAPGRPMPNIVSLDHPVRHIGVLGAQTLCD
jgi:hypothetical protein